MHIPKTLKVGAHQYKIEFDNNIARDCESDGEHKKNKLTIRIQSGLAETYTEEIFIHELLHACFEQMGYEENKAISEEDLTDRLSKVLYMVLKDNELL